MCIIVIMMMIDIRLRVHDTSGSQLANAIVDMQHWNDDRYPFYLDVNMGTTPLEEYVLTLVAGNMVLDKLVVDTRPQDPSKPTSKTMRVCINSAGCGGIQTTLRFKRTKAQVEHGAKMRICSFEVIVRGSVYSEHTIVKKIVAVNNARKEALDKRYMAQGYRTECEYASLGVERHREKIQKHQQKLEDAMKTKGKTESLVLEAESKADALEKEFRDGLEELKGMGVALDV